MGFLEIWFGTLLLNCIQLSHTCTTIRGPRTQCGFPFCIVWDCIAGAWHRMTWHGQYLHFSHFFFPCLGLAILCSLPFFFCHTLFFFRCWDRGNGIKAAGWEGIVITCTKKSGNGPMEWHRGKERGKSQYLVHIRRWERAHAWYGMAISIGIFPSGIEYSGSGNAEGKEGEEM